MVATFLSIQHRLNPLHVYCRFMERGLGRSFSVSVCRSYELLLFIWISWIIKVAIHLCCMVERDRPVEDLLKKTDPRIGARTAFKALNRGEMDS